MAEIYKKVSSIYKSLFTNFRLLIWSYKETDRFLIGLSSTTNSWDKKLKMTGKHKKSN
jgi:hypothetical protein